MLSGQVRLQANAVAPEIRASRPLQHQLMHMCPRWLSSFHGSVRERVKGTPGSAFEADAELAFEFDQAADGAKLGSVFVAA
jgi:hypothetical protein